MKLNDFMTKTSCQMAKTFPYKPKGQKTEHAMKSILMRTACRNMLFGQAESDAKDSFHTGWEQLSFPTQKTREIEEELAWREIIRFVDSEKAFYGSRYNLSPMNVDIGLDEEVFVDPDYVTVDNTPRVVNMELCDAVIRVNKLHVSKAKKNNLKSLARYAMLVYGRKLVSPGKTVLLIANDIYLKRDDDHGPSSKNPNFTNDFYEKGGNNVISLSEVYVGGEEVTATDENFSEMVNSFNVGHDAEECSEEDCASCVLYDICHYSEPPMRVNKTAVNRTIQDLALTDAQSEAIEYEEGICRINAGAGVGKTVVVALRAVTLLNKGVKPSEILLITFTNAGAEEMRTRIKLYNDDVGTGEDISDMKIQTFNAFGDEILKEEFERLGFTEPPNVIDQVERAGIISEILKNNEVDGLNYKDFSMNSKYTKGAVWIAAEVFDIVKRGQYTVSDLDAVLDELGSDIRFCTKQAVEKLIRLYDEYDATLRENNLIEFADQEAMVFEILSRDPFYLEKFGISHIIVDEFQDSNEGQLALLKKLIDVPSFKSLMVVGDDSQAIFGFRNTSPEFMIDFQKYISSEVDDIYLLENHRCTPEIIDFANTLNAKNRFRVDKDLVATRPSGRPVVVRGFHTYEEEQKFIIDSVKKKLASGEKPENIAILCATKNELRKFASLLTKEGIQSVSLNPEKHIENSRTRAVLSFVRALRDDTDTLDLMCYANAKHGGAIKPESTMEEIEALIEDARQDVAAVNELPTPNEKKEKMAELFTAIDLNDDELYQKFIKSLLLKSYDRILDYCRDFAIYGTTAEARREHNYPGVVLTTAHSSKGLEWKIVFASLSKFDDEKLNVHKSSSTSMLLLEERRRLLFVTATRARDELYITSRYVAYGKKGSYTYNQFLIESLDCVNAPLDIALIEAEAEERARIKREQAAERRKEAAKAKKVVAEVVAGEKS